MRSLYLSVDEHVYGKLVDFLKLLPAKQIKIEEIACSKELKKEIAERKKEIRRGEFITHKKFWDKIGV
ncbi:MAG: hypothetical protein A4E64_02851 [Syntrophorhabdus sp. PtaU1.Bin058]|nr:MAG: hypothetical protein A4E64_02851 [Syntrophorhabdus sp. PtaU1.Bin058]